MEPALLLLVVLAAAMHAVWNAVVKSSADRLVAMGLVTATSGIVGAAILPFVPAPSPGSWPFLALTTVIHFAYYYCLAGAYRHGDLSQTYPIARGGSPLILALVSVPVMGEALTVRQFAGVALVSAGIASLAYGRGDRRAVLFAFATSCTIAAYSVTDALGVRRAESPFGYIGWLFALDGFTLAGFALWRRGREAIVVFRRDPWRPLLGGVLSALGYGIVVWCYGQGPVAPISALRETSVVFAALIGALFLGEGFGRMRIAASVLVAVGVAVLNVA